MSAPQPATVVAGATNWPARLDTLGDLMPDQLRYIGDLSLLDPSRKVIAIAGTRVPTSYGAHLAHEIAYDLSNAGVTVITAASPGIAAHAARGAVAGTVWPVLFASAGLAMPHPLHLAGDYREVLDIAGAMISAASDDEPQSRAAAATRDARLGRLADAVVIIEAAHRCGAHTIALEALHVGRPVGAVPGPVTSGSSDGCHTLIRGGAHLIRGAHDVLDLLTS